VIRRIGLLQIDFVNVLVPAQYQVPFSRLGPYDRRRLDHLVYERHEFIEHWAHEASIVPVEHWPLLGHRREAHRVRPYGFERILARHPHYFAWVLEQVRERGPLTADDLPPPPGIARRIPGSWIGTVPRAALEAHFGGGRLAVAIRRPNFQRAYDLTERLIPQEIQGRVSGREEQHRELLRIAARAHGVGSARDLADYYRLPMRDARPRLLELVENGDLSPVKVEGWSETGYLARNASIPHTVDARALLSPFDPVVWFRPRAARLFGFDYRIAIWVPQSRRRWGYYVLPFLMDERLVARVDLKADRAAGRMQVLAAYLEPHAQAKHVAPTLANELHGMAGWLGLEGVDVARRGNLARGLAAALWSRRRVSA